MNECNLNNTAVLLQDNLEENSVNFQFYSLAFRIIESTIFKSTITKTKRKAPTLKALNFAKFCTGEKFQITKLQN